MSLTLERVTIVSSNAPNICALLNVADEEQFLQKYMSPTVFKECIAHDSNMERLQVLCEKVIHELVTGNTNMYDALTEYFLERSQAYKFMHQRFTAFCSKIGSSSSIDDYSELLVLREKVKILTQELLHLRQWHSSAYCQSDVSMCNEQLTEKNAANEEFDAVMHDVMETAEKRNREEAADLQSLMMGPQLSPCRKDINLSIKKEDAYELDLKIVKEELEAAVESGLKSIEDEAEELDFVEEDQTLGENLHSCEYCGKKFAKTSGLFRHVRIHTGERPFACDICGKRFTQRNHLVEHVRIHTGEKPFTCEHCGRRFAIKSTLVKHLRFHTGDRPFACKVCGKRFTQSYNLVKHIRVHEGDKPLACDHAKKKCPLKPDLLKHVRTENSAVTPRKPVATGLSLACQKPHLP